MSQQISKKSIPLRGITISIEDVKRIVERLIPEVQIEGYREVESILSAIPNDLEQLEQLDFQREQACQITITIFGRDGESLFGYGIEPFESPNIPDSIQSVYMTNSTAYHAITGRNPTNSFELLLDFSTPPLIDNNNPVSDPTPNTSMLTVQGDRDSWVASIQQLIMNLLEKRSNRRRLLHIAHIYDLGLLLLGLPSAIYLCWRLANFVEINLGSLNSFLAVAAYIYIVLFVLFIYRVFFGYTRWAFPTVELKENADKSRIHRKLWGWSILTLALSGLYDLLIW